MVCLLVDEGYALDYLSILQVKMEQDKSKINQENFEFCLRGLEQEIGHGKMVAIRQSRNFIELTKTNSKIFETIDRLRNGEQIPASVIDGLNLDRWRYKKTLQKNFFLTELKETKTKTS